MTDKINKNGEFERTIYELTTEDFIGMSGSDFTLKVEGDINKYVDELYSKLKDDEWFKENYAEKYLQRSNKKSGFDFLICAQYVINEIKNRKAKGTIDEKLLNSLKSYSPQYAAIVLSSLSEVEHFIESENKSGENHDFIGKLKGLDPYVALKEIKALKYINSETKIRNEKGIIDPEFARKLTSSGISPSIAQEELFIYNFLSTLTKDQLSNIDNSKKYLDLNGIMPSFILASLYQKNAIAFYGIVGGLAFQHSFINTIKELGISEIIDVRTKVEYTVKKGDNLWNIVKNYYNLTDNKRIADKVNAIVYYNILMKNKLNINIDDYPLGGDGIKGDKINVGDKILLLNN